MTINKYFLNARGETTTKQTLHMQVVAECWQRRKNLNANVTTVITVVSPNVQHSFEWKPLAMKTLLKSTMKNLQPEEG